MEKLAFLFTGMQATGTFFAGFAAVIGIFKILRGSFSYKEETIYGEEAEKRYKNFETNPPSKAKLLGVYEFGGGVATLMPRLRVERIRFNPSMPPEFKRYTQSLRYVEQNKETGKRVEKVWGFK